MQLEQPYQIGEIMFIVFFVGLIGYFIAINVSVLAMHFLMPKAVLDKYFKPPYFREFECEFFTGIPYAPIRTVMFMRVIAFPASGKKRGILDAHTLVPRWYRLLSKFILVTIVAGFALIMAYLIAVGMIYLADQYG